MRLRLLAVVILGGLISFGIVWGVALRPTESARPPLDAIQESLDRDAAKDRFSGRLGEFLVYLRTGPTPERAAQCPPPKTERLVVGAEQLRGHELWSEVFEAGAAGVFCDDQLIVVNSGSDPLPGLGGGGSIVKMYFHALPVPVLFDAPLDRIEEVEIDGHHAVIEHPIEGYPYATASLAVIARMPTGDQPGIVAYVNFAPSSQVAVDFARRMFP